jgi:hypothetical protein
MVTRLISGSRDQAQDATAAVGNVAAGRRTSRSGRRSTCRVEQAGCQVRPCRVLLQLYFGIFKWRYILHVPEGQAPTLEQLQRRRRRRRQAAGAAARHLH